MRTSTGIRDRAGAGAAECNAIIGGDALMASASALECGARRKFVHGRHDSEKAPSPLRAEKACRFDHQHDRMMIEITVFDASGRTPWVRPSISPSAKPVSDRALIEAHASDHDHRKTTMIRFRSMSG